MLLKIEYKKLHGEIGNAKLIINIKNKNSKQWKGNGCCKIKILFEEFFFDKILFLSGKNNIFHDFPDSTILCNALINP